MCPGTRARRTPLGRPRATAAGSLPRVPVALHPPSGPPPVTKRTLADPIRRRRLAAIAGHRGDAAGARQFLHDVDAGVRAAALGALQRADGLTPADLTDSLRDEAPTVRARALEVVAALLGG